MGLLCGLWRRRRPEKSDREAETRKRETLQKKMPISQSPERAVRSDIRDKEPKVPQIDTTVRPAELGAEASPVGVQEGREMEHDSVATIMTTIRVEVDPPPECVELPADPAPRPPPPAEPTEVPESAGSPDPGTPKQFKPYRGTALGTAEGQQIPLPLSCPPCLVPGPSPVAPEDRLQKGLQRAATWSQESSKTMTAFFPTRLGFGGPWWPGTDLLDDGTLSDWQTASPTDASIASASDMSPTFTASPLSSETSLSLRDSPDSKPHSLRQRTMSQISVVSTNPSSPERSLSPRRSSANINQLLARHVMLESRRQILLKLQEIEQEQEEILETLATMPEE